MTESILTSVKKVLGLSESYTAFDQDIILHINSMFSVLNQIGIGPEAGFSIENSTPTWSAFIGSDKLKNSVKTYVCLRVRLLFDPPQTSFVIESLNQQIRELEWRLNVLREATEWVDPDPVEPPADMVLDGGSP